MNFRGGTQTQMPEEPGCPPLAGAEVLVALRGPSAGEGGGNIALVLLNYLLNRRTAGRGRRVSSATCEFTHTLFTQ